MTYVSNSRRRLYGGKDWQGQLALCPAIHYRVMTKKSDGAMNDDAFEIHGTDRSSRWLVTCDHASNHVPAGIAAQGLGISDADLNRHIAFDVGAAGLARHLADLLAAPAILSRFSRLVIDPNRGEDDPTLVMQLYDGTIIPANRQVDTAEVVRRLDRLYHPYHAALAGLANRQDDPVILAIHSFTPSLRGRPPRPWQVGVLYGTDDRLSRALIARLSAQADLCVGDNEPYAGHLPGDAIDRHAIQPGRHNTLIELRNDLIGTPGAQAEWAARLAPALVAALADAGG